MHVLALYQRLVVAIPTTVKEDCWQYSQYLHVTIARLGRGVLSKLTTRIYPTLQVPVGALVACRMVLKISTIHLLAGPCRV